MDWCFTLRTFFKSGTSAAGGLIPFLSWASRAPTQGTLVTLTSSRSETHCSIVPIFSIRLSKFHKWTVICPLIYFVYLPRCQVCNNCVICVIEYTTVKLAKCFKVVADRCMNLCQRLCCGSQYIPEFTKLYPRPAVLVGNRTS